MSVNILTYMLAASLIQGGMNWKQAGRDHLCRQRNRAGADAAELASRRKVRDSVSSSGSGLVRRSGCKRCGRAARTGRVRMFGIQAWIGGEAISTLLATLAPSWKNFPYGPGVCFFLFWLINLALYLKESNTFEFCRHQRSDLARRWTAFVGLGLPRGWWLRAHAVVPSRFTSFPDFLKFLIPALNGTVGFWATVSLNIPDFTRFARNQREQVIGQALALPTTMTLYAFVGIVVTSATVVVYGTALWNPVELLSRFHSPVAVVISLVAILLATLNVNIGANVVSPPMIFPICGRAESASARAASSPALWASR